MNKNCKHFKEVDWNNLFNILTYQVCIGCKYNISKIKNIITCNLPEDEIKPNNERKNKKQ